jgi:hypothetical protein
MNLRRVLAITSVVIISASAFASNARLQGCLDPNVLGPALKNIADRDWETVSETDLQRMWPMELGGAQCSEGACQTLRRRDRIIDDVCECCELFNFTIDRNEHGSAIREQLHSIVIHYSATSRDELLTAARMFARALGLSESEANTIGRKPQQQFYWRVRQSKPQQLALMEVDASRQQGQWRVYLNLSRHLEDAPNPPGGAPKEE